MTDVLARICADKRVEIIGAMAARSVDQVERDAAAASRPRGFLAALDRAVDGGGYGLIAEIKKASPSAGLIRRDFDPASLALAYERGGATCLSVLTDRGYFQGDPEYLRAARAACALPVLRKDFMLHPYQVAEARAMGADCILLIMAALSDDDAQTLEAAALAWGMDVLAEVHDRAELERALRLKTRLIGVNNRNLKTLRTDLATTEELAAAVPRDRRLVSESGLSSPADLARLSRTGVARFLVGESLMRQQDVEKATAALLSRPLEPAPARPNRA